LNRSWSAVVAVPQCRLRRPVWCDDSFSHPDTLTNHTRRVHAADPAAAELVVSSHDQHASLPPSCE